MRTFYNLNLIKKRIRNSIVAIGVFDGVHHGHQALIKKTISRARDLGSTAVVFTFFPHPSHVLRKRKKMALLLSLEHRLALIKSLGVKVCIVTRFTKKFSQLSAETFIKHCLVEGLGIKEIFVGKNFHFGKQRQGNSVFLQKMSIRYGFKANIVDSIKRENTIISSSEIRALIAQGKVEKASQFLGRHFSIFGCIYHGDKRGRKIGFPTANIRTGKELLPSAGVYLAHFVIKNKVYKSIAYIGTRPSFKKVNKIVFEAHILDFRGNIYGESVEVRFLKRLRCERKFKKTIYLIDAIKKDVLSARNFFNLPK